MERIEPAQRFGRWTVLARVPNPAPGRAYWRCRCECGAERDVRVCRLTAGTSRSCGCLAREVAARHGHAASTRGRAATPEYRSWLNMKTRCYDESHVSYPDYGGRGIAVCEQWRADFAAFLADVGPRPGPGYSVDRINNDRGYEPGNVRWATRQEQARNRRNTRLFAAHGEALTTREWSRRTGVPFQTIRGRLHRGWPTEAAISPRPTSQTSRPAGATHSAGANDG